MGFHGDKLSWEVVVGSSMMVVGFSVMVVGFSEMVVGFSVILLIGFKVDWKAW